MSSKGRKEQDENPTEFNPTPEWTVDTLLGCDLLSLPGGTWIEPCAGTGNLIRAVNRIRDDVNWLAYEIDPQHHPALDALMRPGRDTLFPPASFMTAADLMVAADVLLMNPPFSLTMEFLVAAFAMARHVVSLQRTNFFGSQKRALWLRTYCPDIYALPKRPSFREDGSTDSIEYSWFVWPPDPFGRVGPAARQRRVGQLAMLELQGWTERAKRGSSTIEAWQPPSSEA